MNLKCLIGLHKWKPVRHDKRRCSVCKKDQWWVLVKSGSNPAGEYHEHWSWRS